MLSREELHYQRILAHQDRFELGHRMSKHCNSNRSWVEHISWPFGQILRSHLMASRLNMDMMWPTKSLMWRNLTVDKSPDNIVHLVSHQLVTSRSSLDPS